MIEMGVRHQHQIDGRQIAQRAGRAAATASDKEPAREVRIDRHALAADLNEEAGMSDERHP